MRRKDGGLLTVFSIVLGIILLIVGEAAIAVYAAIPEEAYGLKGGLVILALAFCGAVVTLCANYYDNISNEMKSMDYKESDHVRED